MANYEPSQKANLSRGLNKHHLLTGKITSWIGCGANAKHSIAAIVLICSFSVGAVVTLLVCINYWCFRDCENKVPDMVSDLRIIWEIVTPIITLVLGYEFGKYEK